MWLRINPLKPGRFFGKFVSSLRRLSLCPSNYFSAFISPFDSSCRGPWSCMHGVEIVIAPIHILSLGFGVFPSSPCDFRLFPSFNHVAPLHSYPEHPEIIEWPSHELEISSNLNVRRDVLTLSCSSFQDIIPSSLRSSGNVEREKLR